MCDWKSARYAKVEYGREEKRFSCNTTSFDQQVDDTEGQGHNKPMPGSPVMTTALPFRKKRP
jgi:hypothetical protein